SGVIDAGRELLAARGDAFAAAAGVVDRVARGAPDTDRGGVGSDLVGILIASLADETRHRAQAALYQAQERVVILRLVLRGVIRLDLDLRVRAHRQRAAVSKVDLRVAVALGRQHVARVDLGLLRQNPYAA